MTTPLAAALRAAGLTEVDDDTRRRAEYSSDASNHRVVPTAVAYPRDADEVLAALAVCRETGTPLTVRGGGTSIAGNAIGPGLVLDTSRHLTRILALDPDAGTAIVEPGVVLDRITDAGAPHGLTYGPDPSTHSRATIGGTIGNNACGAHAMSAGRAADTVVSLDVVTAAGQRFTAGPRSAGTVPLWPVVDANLAAVRTGSGRFRRQVSGYSLEHLLPENGAHVGRFLAGSEGTLAVLLEATVSLARVPAATALVVLGYPDMPAAADAVPGLLHHAPRAVEGMDARLVDVVRRRRGDVAVPHLPRGEGWLFVEVAGDSPAAAADAATRLVADAGARDSLVVGGADALRLWRIREDGAGLGGRTPAGAPAWPGWEDAAVPPEHLGAYLRGFRALLDDHGLDSLVYGHFGDGCVHARIDFPLADRPQVYREFVTAAADLVAGFGGSVSGEHGDGRARSELLPRMYPPELIAAFAAVKHAFDPGGLLNPGVLVDPEPLDATLRVPHARPLPSRAFALPHDDGDLSVAAHRCVGVGRCRADATATGAVMCPSFLATGDEKDSTRGRARVLQEAANGTLVGGLGSPEVLESLDLCLSCKGCAVDCPAGVDMATYKAEVLHARYRRWWRPRTHWSLGWLPVTARLAARAPRLVNTLLGSTGGAALARAAGGIDPDRDLPRFAEQTFRAWFADRPVRTDGDPVLLLVDTFTEGFTPAVGRAAVAVVEDAGFRVELPAPTCCGLTWISTGQLDTARTRLRQTVRALDRGLPVLVLEPSCAAVLRGDAVELLPDEPAAARVAAATHTLAELLATRPDWTPPDLTDVHGVAQPHCHQHAVLGWDADRALLARAGAQVDAVGGCCGLAGNFGAEAGHHAVSVAVAETALLPAVRAAGEGATVLADGFSCRTQLEQLTGSPGQHLAQLLAARLPPR
ncbi:FAD-binding and (Fe-S)-binding domain-containing protein [Modestobacter sp. Leaf380]|uniref:FAD-binding and (Fe-S)-binding domain-containing protein n=1 Tax=Modestobacter sp. Leaf380 TaxID=1736356 RepID=UPI0006F79510|nr:FAD-binding and (Fe-S)-binding domain-containing protein [Modestobacter sp. Leaf380]KQS67624.1 oxidoreductase [Modestobacter sp. Leaf380]